MGNGVISTHECNLRVTSTFEHFARLPSLSFGAGSEAVEVQNIQTFRFMWLHWKTCMDVLLMTLKRSALSWYVEKLHFVLVNESKYFGQSHPTPKRYLN